MRVLFVFLPVVLGFTVRPVTVSHSSFKTQLDAVGIFFGTSTGNTESVAELISAEFGDDASEPIDIDSVQGKLADEFAKYDALIVGTPTWNTGADTERSGTGWDEVYYGEMQDLKLQGKNVAVFGLGDSVSYAENYADGTGELHDVFQALGCNMLGYVSQEGYEHEASKAIRGDLFCGLPLDNVNFEELTAERVSKWVAQLKDEGILDLEGSGSRDDESVETPDPVMADLDAALRMDLEESSSLLTESISKVGAGGFTPHYNAKTGRTMWTSADGRTCYYTEASAKVSP
ncbi:flavodoxin [Fragilaria crotonensis]|nr:flavodoxin [Fragilaria crotonensis]